jgi:hypothetical protein
MRFDQVVQMQIAVVRKEPSGFQVVFVGCGGWRPSLVPGGSCVQRVLPASGGGPLQAAAQVVVAMCRYRHCTVRSQDRYVVACADWTAGGHVAMRKISIVSFTAVRRVRVRLVSIWRADPATPVEVLEPVKRQRVTCAYAEDLQLHCRQRPHPYLQHHISTNSLEGPEGARACTTGQTRHLLTRYASTLRRSCAVRCPLPSF